MPNPDCPRCGDVDTRYLFRQATWWCACCHHRFAGEDPDLALAIDLDRIFDRA